MFQTLQSHQSNHAADEHGLYYDHNTGAAALHHVSTCLWLFKHLPHGLLTFGRHLPQSILILRAAEALTQALT